MVYNLTCSINGGNSSNIVFILMGALGHYQQRYLALRPFPWPCKLSHSIGTTGVWNYSHSVHCVGIHVYDILLHIDLIVIGGTK